jgi:hypothetical protein
MKREHIAGFMLGLSVGTTLGLFVRAPEKPAARKGESVEQGQRPVARILHRMRTRAGGPAGNLG